jgi:hypothetical protein
MATRINACIAAAIAVVSCSLSPQQALAFTIPSSQQSSIRSVVSTALYSSSTNSEEQQQQLSRRSVLSKILTSTTAAAAAAASSAVILFPNNQPANAASPSIEPYLTDLQTSLTQISKIPPLLQNAEWDAARTILKTPPVNQLWNLGESSNPLVKLAKETGDFDIMEMKDELAISLQMTDQFSYDNVFIYYQPGEF